jgi:hypothetical protein
LEASSKLYMLKGWHKPSWILRTCSYLYISLLAGRFCLMHVNWYFFCGRKKLQ